MRYVLQFDNEADYKARMLKEKYTRLKPNQSKVYFVSRIGENTVKFDSFPETNQASLPQECIVIEATGDVQCRKYTTASAFTTLTYSPNEDGVVIIDTTGWYGMSLTPMWMADNANTVKRFLYANFKLKNMPYCFVLFIEQFQNSGIEWLYDCDWSEMVTMGNSLHMSVYGGTLERADLSKLNVSNKCTAVNTAVKQLSNLHLDCSGWDTSNVTNISSFIAWTYAGIDSARPFREINLTGWDFSKVKNANYFFAGAGIGPDTVIVPNPGDWNFKVIESLGGFFQSCFDWERVDCSKWVVDNVTNMQELCATSGFKYVNFEGWNTPKLTNTYLMFYGCNLSTILGIENEDELVGTGDNKVEVAQEYAKTTKGVFNGLKESLDLSSCKNIGLISVATLINSLGTVTNKVLTLPSSKYRNMTGINKLTAPAIAKGWSIAFA